MLRVRTLLPPAALGLALGLLTACGGGGGGASAPPSPVYTGSRSQAVITAANATALTQGAVGGAQAGAVTLAKSDLAATGANGTTGTLTPVDCASFQVCYDLNDGTGSHCDLKYYN